jgi:lipopolysaccharide transport system ATP-binding protein
MARAPDGSAPAVLVDRVWKKFRRGEGGRLHRDLLRGVRRWTTRRRDATALDPRAQEHWALEDVSFHVEAGEALGIIGPNGAGKSTLLKLLTRILAPTRGQCHVRGRIGALIEVTAGFHGDLTGRENIYLQGALMGMRRAEIARLMDAIIGFAGLEAFIDTPVKRLSTGMSARLGFSIAAHLDPDVLLIDEVLSVGDAAFQERCVERMRAFKASGIAIVFVSHHLEHVSTLCDRALYIQQTVRAAGAPGEVIGAFLDACARESAERGTGEVVIDRAELTDAAGRPVRAVPPGTALVLTVTCRAQRAVSDPTFAFTLHRSTDGRLVHEATVSAREVGVTGMQAGVPVVLRFTFRAHLVRGHYHVGCRVHERATRRILAQRIPAGTLAIDEHRTYAGVADVGLTVTRVADDALAAERVTDAAPPSSLPAEGRSAAGPGSSPGPAWPAA